jgi:hypothetical protein
MHSVLELSSVPGSLDNVLQKQKMVFFFPLFLPNETGTVCIVCEHLFKKSALSLACLDSQAE